MIDKAKEACNNAGQSVPDHFADVSKTTPMPKGAEKDINDVMLTRYSTGSVQRVPMEDFCSNVYE